MEQQLAQNIPGYKMFIVWDLDDTVFDTEHALVNWINKKYNANYVWGNRLGRKGVEGERLMDALEDAFFMRDGVFCPGWEKFLNGYALWSSRILKLVTSSLLTVVTTNAVWSTR